MFDAPARLESALGIRHVFSIAGELEWVSERLREHWVGDLHHTVFDILDVADPESKMSAILSEAVPAIIDALDRGENVLVHCSAGVSRSGTVVTAVVRRLFGLSVDDALEAALPLGAAQPRL